MIKQIIKIAIFLILVYLLHASFMTGLFYPLNKIIIFLPIIIFLLVLYDAKVTLIFSVVFAVFSATASSLPFLLSIFVLPLATLALISVFRRFFTNKSVYSILALNTIILCFFHLLNTVFFLIYHFYHYKTFSKAINYGMLFSSLIWQFVLSTIFVLIAFFIINYFSNKLKTVYIETKS